SGSKLQAAAASASADLRSARTTDHPDRRRVAVHGPQSVAHILRPSSRARFALACPSTITASCSFLPGTHTPRPYTCQSRQSRPSASRYTARVVLTLAEAPGASRRQGGRGQPLRGADREGGFVPKRKPR